MSYWQQIPLEKRFAINQQGAENGCIEWTGYSNKNGYGHIFGRGRMWVAHRLAWELAKGPIPKGLLACHHCDNKKCVNVEHLFLGTQADNNRDRDQKGRAIILRGSKSGMAKLTEQLVAEIKLSKDTTKNLSARFKVAGSTIDKIRSNRAWRHV